MDTAGGDAMGYVVPTYRAEPDEAWFHFLHGNVPGHRIDFIYRPDVPAGALTRQHFSHLTRLVKYIEPRSRRAYAFAIGNLSRDDTQYEPGRGGVALIFGLRIHGAKDHAGRQDPPFCHAMAAVDRHLDAAGLLGAALAFHDQLLPVEESEVEGSGFYHTYLRHAQNRQALLPLLRAYLADFDELPRPGQSALGFRWTAQQGKTPSRIEIVHREEASFEEIAACAARIAGVLMESDIRWTMISSGREADIPGGMSVRFVPDQETFGDPGVRVLRIEEVPIAPKEIAEQLLGAREVRISQLPVLQEGWRQIYVREDIAEQEQDEGERGSIEVNLEAVEGKGETSIMKPRRRFGLLVGLGAMVALGGAALAMMSDGQEPEQVSAATVQNQAREEEKSAPASLPPATAASSPPVEEEKRAVPPASVVVAAAGKRKMVVRRSGGGSEALAAREEEKKQAKEVKSSESVFGAPRLELDE